MEEEITIRVESNCSKPRHTLHPITYVSWFLGVGVARPDKWPKPITMIFRGLHLATCSVAVAFSVMDFKEFQKEFTSELFEIMYCMNETICHVSAYYYVFHAIQHYDKWPELMRIMESLDVQICRELPINDGPVRIGQILAILIVFLLGPVSLVGHVLYYQFIAPDQIFASDLFLYYTIAQTLTNSFVFDLVVYMICNRFRTINGIIEQLDEISGAYWATMKIRRIRKLHSEACSVITKANEIYGIDLLLCSTNAFIMVVTKLFRIYMSAAEHKSGFIFLNNEIWMIYGGQFIVMCWVCTLTHREIDKIGPFIEKFVLNNQHSTKFNQLTLGNFRNKSPTRLEICNDSADLHRPTMNLNGFGMETLLLTNFERDCVRNEVNDFMLQLQQYRVKFTACDFFEMDNSLLTRFVSVITTYLIILVQFYELEESSRSDKIIGNDTNNINNDNQTQYIL
ncbi:uncharacterized protein LOC143145552 isoform X2 [Ptiloglossa arizonensis]|uniref:uncharacterized protein LOC143145552 isoform X2 n=1 Tax=Ptiloglossa arizonensis TaxID=3350558 RepID=UPI003FA14D24